MMGLWLMWQTMCSRGYISSPGSNCFLGSHMPCTIPLSLSLSLSDNIKQASTIKMG